MELNDAFEQEPSNMEQENNTPEEVQEDTNELHIDTSDNVQSILSDQEHVNLSELHNAVSEIKEQLAKVIVGQTEMIDLVLISLFTRSHVLLEGMPGIAKTLSSKLLAKTLDASFSRIQFTPDLMPTDVIGTSIFNMQEGVFNFKKGPIFSNFILIDEINRSPAKTQAALLEVMEERQITADGQTYKFEEPFIVLATQNPVEQEGTYSLPEAQLDRFLFRIRMDYPSLEEEIELLTRIEGDFNQTNADNIQPTLNQETLVNCMSIIEKIYIKKDLIEYIATIVDQTRNNPDLYLGASPRASINIMKASKAIAAMRGRDFVTPEDIQYVAIPVLNHRIVLSPDKEMEGVTIDQVIENIIERIEVPR